MGGEIKRLIAKLWLVCGPSNRKPWLDDAVCGVNRNGRVGPLNLVASRRAINAKCRCPGIGPRAERKMARTGFEAETQFAGAGAPALLGASAGVGRLIGGKPNHSGCSRSQPSIFLAAL